MSEPAIRCDKCGKKFCRSEGDMNPLCGECRWKESVARAGIKPQPKAKIPEGAAECYHCGNLYEVKNNGVLCDHCMGTPDIKKKVEGEALANSQWQVQTKMHIFRVRELLQPVIVDLVRRGDNHDATKLLNPERPIFAEYTRKLKNSTYMSDEYKGFLEEMKPALDHHYAMYRHHPEHFPNGVADMNLIDLLEMLADWKAASERHADGNMKESIEKNAERFNIPTAVVQILANTVFDMKWD